jgi:hypothetical protein
MGVFRKNLLGKSADAKIEAVFGHRVNKVLALFQREKKKIGVKIMSNTEVNKKETFEEMTTNKNRLLTERQSAAYIGISYESLKRSVRWLGKIPFYRVNKRISYRIKDLDEFMEQCRVPAKQN